MQLSDLLRYAMYETNKPKVALEGEVEFMRNYIELMKLRCNEMTRVNSQFTIQNSQLEVAPLLFISLIENAFKHGMNSNATATIDISLTQQDSMLVFNCDNEPKALITHLTMKAVEEMLPKDRFLRIHRSYIIAVDKIQKVDRNDCVYIGKEIIHIPDGYLQTFRQFLETRSIEKR